MNWTTDQQNIIDSRNCNLLVSAAAGSGKTAVLVERIIQMISDKTNPINVDELLVVTFTKAAASQMKDKIRRAIEEKVDENPDDTHFQKQLYLLNRANILTIDSFCKRVVKENFHVLEIDPSITIGEAGEIALLKGEVLEYIIEKYYETRPDFVRFSEAFCLDKNDDLLPEYITKIYDVCSSYPRPEEWLENAKKDLLIQTEEDFMKLQYVNEYMKQVRFTAEQIKLNVLNALEIAREPDGPIYMEKSLLDDVVYVDDVISSKTYTHFHEASVHKFPNIGRGKAGTFDPELAEKVKKIRKKYKDELSGLLSMFEQPMDVVLEQFKEQASMLSALIDITQDFRKLFLEEKIKHNILEFSDVEHLALEVLCAGYDENNNPIPSVVGLEMSEGFYEIMIDEYQDSNYLQEAILNCVSRVSLGQNNIFMVGDVKQSIYKFRMARPDLFMDKYDNYSLENGASERKILLKNNFRSRATVLESINYIFYQIMGKDLGGIDYTKDEALVPSLPYPEYDNVQTELLVGESKDFEFLKVTDETTEYATAQKDENLDENLEDIEKTELEATMVANRIEALFGKDGSAPYQVTDSTTGKLRDICFKDIVLLFRSPAPVSDIYYDVLTKRNIPVRVQNEVGYLNTTEIRQILSLLRTMDNQYNEVELVATMRGFFGRFSEEELTKLIVEKRNLEKNNNRKIKLYNMMDLYVNSSEYQKECEDFSSREHVLYEKIKTFVGCIENLKSKQLYLSLGQLMHYICYDLYYYYYVQALPEGRERIRNLSLFVDEVNNYEKNDAFGLFEFLKYIDGILEKQINLGGDSSVECEDDVVRIMSIHKSKGLEFPVVFVSGLGKQYNLQDTKKTLIVHADYHLGAHFVDTEKRSRNDTIMRKTMSSLINTESIGEELRVLYVALTRAKEKLIMTGVVPDVPKLIEKYAYIADCKEQKLGFRTINSSMSYLELIVAALIRNRTFYDSLDQVQNRMDKKGENIISAEYEFKYEIQEPKIDLRVRFFDYHNITVSHISQKHKSEFNHFEQIEEWKNSQDNNASMYEKNMEYQYPKDTLTKQKSKMSVTQIKRIYEVDYEPSDVVHRDDSNFFFEVPVPKFLDVKTQLSASQKGTLVHKAMELFDFKNVDNTEKIKTWMERIDAERRLEYDMNEILTVDKIASLVDSELGKRMRAADKENCLFKERKFVVGVPVSKIWKEINPASADDKEQTVVVQGIIDAYFEEDDKIILLDYKTDGVKPEQEAELIKRYETQLSYYKDTLEQLTHKEVSETYIYSFALDKAIRVF